MASRLTWLVSGVGVISSAAAAVHPALLIPVAVILIALGTLPLLITTVALVAVFSPDPDRRSAAHQVLDRLLATLGSGDAARDISPVIGDQRHIDGSVV